MTTLRRRFGDDLDDFDDTSMTLDDNLGNNLDEFDDTPMTF